MNYYFENQCVRVLEGDPRMAELSKQYFTIGFTHEVVYRHGSPPPYDIEWEKKMVLDDAYNLTGHYMRETVIVKEADDSKKGGEMR